MASESERIRQLMDLLEGNTQPLVLNEGWVDRIASAFNGKSMGANERSKMAKELYKEWNKWLGSTDRTGDLEDMVRFMKMRVGFNDSDVQIVFDRAGISGGHDEEPETDEQPEAAPEKAAEQQPETPSSDSDEYDPEEGVPLPKDLNTKLSDYKDKGKPASEEKVVRENPRAYLLPNGDFDRQKARARLKNLPKGTVLKIGNRSLRLTSDGDNKFFDGKESISEASGQQGEALSGKLVKEIMDYVAAQVNDQYLLNGPDRDMDEPAYGSRGRQPRSNFRAGSNAGEKPTTGGDATEEPASRGAGRYDSKMMKNILKVELELSDTTQSAIAQKVKQQDYNGMARMTETDMDVLARIGYAFLKAK